MKRIIKKTFNIIGDILILLTIPLSFLFLIGTPIYAILNRIWIIFFAWLTAIILVGLWFLYLWANSEDENKEVK